jgi:hypothetical protein
VLGKSYPQENVIRIKTRGQKDQLPVICYQSNKINKFGNENCLSINRKMLVLRGSTAFLPWVHAVTL